MNNSWNTSSNETNQSRFSPLQKLWAGLATVGTVGYGLYNPKWLWETVSWAASSVHDVIQWWGELINEGIQTGIETVWQNIPFFWAAAPFAAPMIAGWYLGKKLADIAWVESRAKKIAASVLWTWLSAGAVLASPVLAPYITGVWVATALYKPFKWSVKKLWKSAASLYGGVTWVVWGAVKWAAMWGYYGTKTNWNQQNIIPDIGFQRKPQQSS